MKFCYIDESGISDPIAVMAGIVTDAARMAKTKQEWAGLLAEIASRHGRDIEEISGKEIYPGNGPWRGIDGPDRHAVISEVLDWFVGRKHKIFLSALKKPDFDTLEKDHPIKPDIGTIWRALAFHLALGLQKKHQSETNNKGHTVLIFDNRDRDQRDFTNLILSPPAWSETFYGRDRNQCPLDQIIDVPHFVDSKHVGLIQAADLVAYVSRLFLEIKEGHTGGKIRRGEESQFLEKQFEKICSALTQRVNLLPTQSRCACAEFFDCLTPGTLWDHW